MIENSFSREKYKLIEELFSSKGRTRLLVLLAKQSELNISEIIRQVNLNFSTVKKHLDFLKSIDLIEEKRFGRIRIYRFKDENVIGKAIKSLIEIFEQLSMNREK